MNINAYSIHNLFAMNYLTANTIFPVTCAYIWRAQLKNARPKRTMNSTNPLITPPPRRHPGPRLLRHLAARRHLCGLCVLLWQNNDGQIFTLLQAFPGLSLSRFPNRSQVIRGHRNQSEVQKNFSPSRTSPGLHHSTPIKNQKFTPPSVTVQSDFGNL